VKKLIFITSNYGIERNGPATFANNFVQKMQEYKDQWKLFVVAMDTSEAKYGETLVYQKRSRYFGATLVTAFQLRRVLKRLIKEERVDALFFNMFRLSLFSLNLGVPVYININDYFFTGSGKKSLKDLVYYRFWKGLYTRILGRSRLNFVNSHFTMKNIMEGTGLPRERFKITYKGIPLEGFDFTYSEISHNLSLLFVGSNFRRKGLETLFQGLLLFKEKNRIPFTLKIVGDDPAGLEHFEKRRDELGLTGDVEFLGRKTGEEIKALHREAHILFLLSKREALGVSLIEAMASGTSVIATRVGGIPEIVEHNQSGILVNPEDPTAVADALEYYLDHEDKRKAFAKKAQDSLDKFDYQTVFDKIYQELG